MTRDGVPAVATWLLQSVLPIAVREAVLGDLYEEYGIRAVESTPSAARRWYWSQAGRSIVRVALARILRGGWLPNLFVAVAAYVVVGAINSAGIRVSSAFLGVRAGGFGLPSAFVGLAAIGTGGYLAACLRRGASNVLGFLVAVVAVVLMASPRDTAPLWYQLLFLVFGPTAAAVGGALRHARRPPATGSSD